MSVIVRGIDIPAHGCSECPLAHKVFNGMETVLACYAVQKETSDDGERPNWCPLQKQVSWQTVNLLMAELWSKSTLITDTEGLQHEVVHWADVKDELYRFYDKLKG